MAEPAGTDGPSWRALVEAGTDGLWLLDVDGTTVWANRRLGELLGRGDDDLVGLPAAEAFPAEARARVARHLSLLARATRGRDNVAMQVQRADGTLVPVVGLEVIAGVFAVIAVVVARAIHRRPLLSPWLLLGVLPTLLGLAVTLR